MQNAGGATEPHRIVVVGGGAAGLELVTRLGNTLGRTGRAQVTLVEKGRTHLWKPLLHSVAAGSLDRSQHELNYLAQAHWHHFRYCFGEMVGLDRDRREVLLGATKDDEGRQITPPSAVPYDTLILSIGSVTNDFGTPVEGCEVPWSRAQFAFAYDSAKTTPPQDMPALLDWIRANPGQFTYPAPPDFNGSVFVRHVFYHAAGGADNLMGPFDPEKYDAVAAKTWVILNDLEPYLWRQGQTYPNTITQLNDLFSNAEVAMTFDYDASQFGLAVQAGKYPETTRSYGLRDGTIGNTNYTVIPFNSPNKAAALVLQNLMISAAAQLDKARPEVWGAAPAIEMDRTDVQAEFAALPSLPAVVSSAELAKHALPELQAEWSAEIDQGWIKNVGR